MFQSGPWLYVLYTTVCLRWTMGSPANWHFKVFGLVEGCGVMVSTTQRKYDLQSVQMSHGTSCRMNGS